MGDEHVDCLEDLVDRRSWMLDALCREHPEMNRFPGEGDDFQAAQAICGRCLAQEFLAEVHRLCAAIARVYGEVETATGRHPAARATPARGASTNEAVRQAPSGRIDAGAGRQK
jgi:hypothetical protein